MNIDELIRREEPANIPNWDDIRRRLEELCVRRVSISVEMLDELIESERDRAYAAGGVE